jgi:SAM-dependent methyltransferase
MSAMNYFYAEDDAAIYDRTVFMTDPHYGELHGALDGLFRQWISTEHQPSVPSGPVVVDIGCGTGAEAMRLLESTRDISLVAIDISARMLDVLEEKLIRRYGDNTAGGRCKLVCLDVREKGWMAKALELVQKPGSRRTCDAAISVYALHHLDVKMKRQVYREIFDHLSPRGIFANADLFAFETKWLADYAQTMLEEWINKQFTDPAAPHYKDGPSLASDRQRLMANWLCHVHEENCPLPAIPSAREQRGGVKSVSEQDILTAVGFPTTECVYRSGQSAILWASKE